MTKALALLLISIVSQANGFFFGGYRPLFYGGYGGFGGFGGYGLGGFGRYGGFGFGGHGRYKRSVDDVSSDSYSQHDSHHDLVPDRHASTRSAVVERVHTRPAVAASHDDGNHYSTPVRRVHSRPASAGSTSHRAPVHRRVLPAIVDHDDLYVHAAGHGIGRGQEKSGHGIGRGQEKSHRTRPVAVGHTSKRKYTHPAIAQIQYYRTPVRHIHSGDLHHDLHHDLVPVGHALSHAAVRPLPVVRIHSDHDADYYGTLVRHLNVGGDALRHHELSPVHHTTLRLAGVHALPVLEDHSHYGFYKTPGRVHTLLAAVHDGDHSGVAVHGAPIRRVHIRPVLKGLTSHRTPVHNVVRPAIDHEYRDYHDLEHVRGVNHRSGHGEERSY